MKRTILRSAAVLGTVGFASLLLVACGGKKDDSAAVSYTHLKWWIERLRESFKIYDIVRIDHFRGFESYWEIPAGSDTAAPGKWVKGPGYKLFAAVKEELGDLNIIAEDLGFMTDEVIELRERTGFPGMKILQFAFNPDDESIDSPHLAPNNSVKMCIRDRSPEGKGRFFF